MCEVLWTACSQYSFPNYNTVSIFGAWLFQSVRNPRESIIVFLQEVLIYILGFAIRIGTLKQSIQNFSWLWICSKVTEDRGLNTGALNIFCNLMHVLVWFRCFDKMASSLVVKALWEILKLQNKSLLKDPVSLSSSSAKLQRAVVALGAKDELQLVFFSFIPGDTQLGRNFLWHQVWRMHFLWQKS